MKTKEKPVGKGPKKSRPPEFNLRDEISVSVFGEHAVAGTGLMAVSTGRTVEVAGRTAQKIIVVGVFLAEKDWNEGNKEWVRWDCDVVLIPKRKFDGCVIKGGTADQYLTGGLQELHYWNRQILPTICSVDEIMDEMK